MEKKNELIKITEKEGKSVVSARELYYGLGLDKSNWSRWSKQNIEEDDFFEENEEWAGFVTMTNGNETKDYAITLNFAKHLAMMAKTKKSHDYRNYFIECEKKAKSGNTITSLREEERKLSYLKGQIASASNMVSKGLLDKKGEYEFLRTAMIKAGYDAQTYGLLTYEERFGVEAGDGNTNGRCGYVRTGDGYEQTGNRANADMYQYVDTKKLKDFIEANYPVDPSVELKDRPYVSITAIYQSYISHLTKLGMMDISRKEMSKHLRIIGYRIVRRSAGMFVRL